MLYSDVSMSPSPCLPGARTMGSEGPGLRAAKIQLTLHLEHCQDQQPQARGHLPALPTNHQTSQQHPTSAFFLEVPSSWIFPGGPQLMEAAGGRV